MIAFHIVFEYENQRFGAPFGAAKRRVKDEIEDETYTENRVYAVTHTRASGKYDTSLLGVGLVH